LIITRLSVEGFRKLSCKFTIEFPTEGIIGISGRNECGKSTIFDAIEFALFGLSPRRTFTKEDIIAWGKDRLSVELHFTSANKKYEIVRTLTKKIHRVKLVGYDRNEVVTEVYSVNAVEQTIREIVGLDGESYSKLIYIRQNELDVLKDLERGDRTHLINSVMGIDVFDEAQSRLDSDCKQEIRQHSILQTDVKHLKDNHDRYEGKLNEKAELEEKLKKLLENLDPLEKEKNSMKEKTSELMWLREHNSTKALFNSATSEFSGVKSQISAYNSDSDKHDKFNGLYQTWEPKIRRLNEGLEKLKSKEKEIKMTTDSIQQLEKRLSESSTQKSIKGSTRSSQLAIAITLIVAGALSLALTIFAWYLFLVGALLILLSILYFRRYKQTESLMINQARDQA